MKNYIEEIKSVIVKQLDKLNEGNELSKKIIIKVESFGSNRVYFDLCECMDKFCSNSKIKFIAKISKEKYEAEKNDVSIINLERKGWVEKNNTLTKWRNEEIDDKALILLMASELVEDKGGLHDFFTINPELIDKEIGNNYSRFFNQPDLKIHAVGKEGVINNFFQNLFIKIPKNLIKLSDIFDELEKNDKYDYKDLDDIFNIICKRFFIDWKIPTLLLNQSNLLEINNSKGKITILDKMMKFKERMEFEGINESKYKTYIKKIEVYEEENDWDDEIIPDFEDFKEQLINYISGKNLEESREKLFEIDFNKINAILEIKEKGEEKEKSALIKLKGDPLLELMKGIGHLLYAKTKLKKEEVDFNNIETTKITMKITDVSLKENTEEEEDVSLYRPWNNLCRYLGGIISYIEDSNIFCNSKDESIRIEYDNSLKLIENKDFFSKENYKKLKENLIIKKMGYDKKYSIIKFRMTCFIENEEEKFIDFEYAFFPEEVWTQNFSYFDEIIKKMETDSYLPILSCSNLKNFLVVHDEEDFSISLKNCQFEENGNFISEISKDPNIVSNEFIKLGMRFKELVESIENEGYYKVLSKKEGNKITAFISVYSDVAKKLLDDDLSKCKQVINYFINQFMVLENKDKFKETGAIKTAISLSIHPAMLEKTFEKNRFLTEGFREILKKIINEKSKKKDAIKMINDKADRLISLVTISSAVDILPKVVRGEYSEVAFCYGMYCFYKNNKNLQEKEIINFATLKKDEITINEEVDAKEFDVSSSYSKIICKTIQEYIKLFRASIDGLELLFINPCSLQHIVASLQELFKAKDMTEYVRLGLKIRLNVLTDDSNIGGDNYLSNWINSNSNDPNIKISVYYSNFSEDEDIVEAFLKMSNNKFIDIVFIGNILKETSILFEKGENYYNDLYDIKFPMLYKPILTGQKNRKIEISQPQFKIATLHSQLCYKISNDQIDSGYCDKLIFRESEFTKEREDMIEIAHKNARWVSCLDKSIDKELLTRGKNKNKIISFTTGEGPFGEYNTTLSTNFANFGEIEKRLKIKMNEFLDDSKDIELACEKIISYSDRVEGTTLLKAINLRDRQINNYLTYILVNEYLDLEKFSNKFLINLDAYRHWFIGSETMPDYLEMEINFENDKLVFKANIIECKLAQENEWEVKSAKNQIISGFKRLSEIFNPNRATIESRYWNLQLYKVALYSFYDKSKFGETMETSLLKNILENNYSFEWNGEVLYFLKNVHSDNCEDISQVADSHEDINIDISVVNIGKDEIRELLVTGNKIPRKKISEEEKRKEIIGDFENQKEMNGKLKKEENYMLQEEIQMELQEMSFEEKIEKKEDELKMKEIDQEEKSIKNLIKDIIVENLNDEIQEEINYSKDQLIKLLGKLRGISSDVSAFEKGYEVGPNFIRLKLEPKGKTSVQNIKSKCEDIKVWLSLSEIPYISANTGYISIDIPRKKASTIHLGNVLDNNFKEKLIDCNGLKFMIGVDELYKPIIINMEDSNNPHMLIAGQSGSGKSVLLNCIILGIMLNHTPEEVKLLLIDPKNVELTPFKNSPFLERKIVTGIEEAIEVLKEITIEMDRRYSMFADLGARDLKRFNQKTSTGKLNRILIVFDEFGEFMLQEKKQAKEIENSITRIAQKGRAAGIHLIIATQSPKADIITTTIKNNLPSRVALSVPDTTASQVILDMSGAENLYGKGDLLFKSPEYKTPKRLRSPFIDEDNLEGILESINKFYIKGNNEG